MRFDLIAAGRSALCDSSASRLGVCVHREEKNNNQPIGQFDIQVRKKAKAGSIRASSINPRSSRSSAAMTLCPQDRNTREIGGDVSLHSFTRKKFEPRSCLACTLVVHVFLFHSCLWDLSLL